MYYKFFDFEVFPNWWCCIFGDLNKDWYDNKPDSNIKENFIVISSEDPDSRDKLMSQFKDPNSIKSGYNIKHYDLIIANAIWQGLSPQEVYKVSELLIKPELAETSKEHYMLLSFTKRKLNKILYQDLFDDSDKTLKQKEAVLGLNILESSVPFGKNDLTDEEKQDIIYYCKQDVYAAMVYYMEVVSVYTETKMAIADHFGVDKDSCYKSTNARVISLALKAQKQEFDDSEKIDITLPSKISEYCFENVPSRVLNKLLTSKNAFTEKLFNNTVSYGNGGIHSVYSKNLYVESNEDWMLMNIDAESYYPSLMIQFDLLSRTVSDRQALSYIFNERMSIKHKTDKTEREDLIQKADKLILNTTFGASGNKWIDLYDPYMCSKVCRVGQILLTALANKLYYNINGIKIIQTNTDGILAYFRRKDLDKVRKLENEWVKISGINLEEDFVDKIWQKDVNNYILVKDNGKIKRKGDWCKNTFFNPGYVTLKPLDCYICNTALVEYLVNGIDIVDTIKNCKDLKEFAMTCDKGLYSGMLIRYDDGEESFVSNTNRLIASNMENAGKLYKYRKKSDGTLYNHTKVSDTPDRCCLINDDLKNYNFDTISEMIDYDYYIERTIKRINLGWKEFVNNDLVYTYKFDYNR